MNDIAVDAARLGFDSRASKSMQCPGRKSKWFQGPEAFCITITFLISQLKNVIMSSKFDCDAGPSEPFRLNSGYVDRVNVANSATFLRSCVAQALSRGDVPRRYSYAPT